ncbi:benzoate membrane transport protein [Nocardioides massiliensis]|uniref:Benzoate membrane transport protein n=3 Tax=Nocardioides massiliensis TaxID=1325935 RepID=A0ABT9NPC6_9ACTN|nr:benzoate membrane transport protein [Nocardioides massiliensis]
MMWTASEPHDRTAVLAGVVTALVGFTSSFAVVLAGLRAVGASPAEAASGLLALSVTMGPACIWLSLRHRMPITAAWSTPGAALLVTTGAVAGGWPVAVGAFLVCAALVLLTGLWARLGALIAGIPAAVAQAMLAGVLVPLCVVPVTSTAERPLLMAPTLLVWLALTAVRSRWASPAALTVALGTVVVALAVDGDLPAAGDLVPRLVLTVPELSWQGVVGIAVPLWVVTMASQNLPGVAVMSSFGYAVPWRPSMTVTAIGTAVAAPAGGHLLNLAAISAAIAAGPDAHPDSDRRWIAGVSTGVGYTVLGLASAALTALMVAAPAGIVEAAAGLALLGTLAAALRAALGDPRSREAAVVTFVVAVSGVSVAGVGAAFWALVAGLVVHGLVSRRTPPS